MQLLNNAAHSTRFIYGDPMRDGRKWITWYFGEVGPELLKRMLSNGTK